MPYHHGDLRQAIIETAWQIISDSGIEGLTMREIATRIGVSRNAFYRHFTNKELLLAALAEEGFQSLFMHLKEVAAQLPPDSLARLQESCVAYILHAVNHPVHYRVMFDSSLSNRKIYESLYETARQNLDLLMNLITDCQKNQLIRPGDPKELAQIHWSLLHGLSMLYIDNQFIAMGCAPIAELANSAVGALIEGVATDDKTIL
jgi:AcrR family transcriptional regulator